MLGHTWEHVAEDVLKVYEEVTGESAVEPAPEPEGEDNANVVSLADYRGIEATATP